MDTQFNLNLQKLNKIYSSNKNIHSVSKEIVKLISIFIQFDENYCITANFLKNFNIIDFENITRNILLQENNKNNRNKLNKILQTIKRNRRKNDKETKLNVFQLFAKVHFLSQKYREEYLLIDNLKQNFLQKGGCLAGISVRLTQLYTYFMHKEFLELTNLEKKYF